MTTTKMVLLGVAGALLVGVMATCGTVVGTYNGIQRQQTQIDGAAAQIKVQLKRRLDLLPNLASTVQGYATHERGTFTEIAAARARLGGVIQASGAANIRQLAQADATLGGTIGRLLALSENYPQLQASQGFRDLQAQLEGTENRIAVARQDYNTTVQTYNAFIRVFPRNVIAGAVGATPRD